MIAINNNLDAEKPVAAEIDSAVEWRLSKKINESAFKVTEGSEEAKCIHQSRTITC